MRSTSTLLAVTGLVLSTLVPGTALADHQPDADDGPFTDQTVAGDPECTATEFPGQRSLVGERQRQMFVPSRGELSAVDLCLRSSVRSPVTVTVQRLDDAGEPVEVEGQANLVAEPGTSFQRVAFEADLALAAGQPYLIEVTGPASLDTPSAVLAWRLTCDPTFSLFTFTERCSSGSEDRYPQGQASNGAYGANADFGFRSLTPTSADLRAMIDGPRQVCRDHTFPATVDVTNDGDADIRSSTLRVYLSPDRVIDEGDAVLAEHDLPPLGPGQTWQIDSELTVSSDALGEYDGRAVLLASVDDDDVVVESDETNNVATTPTILTGCGPVEVDALLAAAEPAVPAGVGFVPITDLPIGTIPFGGSGLAATPLNTNPLNTNPLNTNPLNTNPLNTNPLLDAPLNTNPLNTNPLNTNPLNTNPLNVSSFLFGAPYRVLGQTPLTSIGLLRDGGWQAVLDRHAEIVAATGEGSAPIAHVPLQDLTLLDVMQLDPVPSPPITFGELDLSSGPLSGIVLAAAATGATPLEHIELPGSRAWCDLLSEKGLDCATLGIDEATATLVTVNLFGLAGTDVPFDQITMDGVTLHDDAPLAVVTLQSDDPTREFDPRLTPWADVAVTGSLEDLVDCARIDCADDLVLRDVADADAFAGGTLADLLDALSQQDLAEATLGDAIRGTIHNAAALPFEGARLDAVPLSALVQDGPFVTYELTATVGDTSMVDPTFTVTLPPDFAYVPDSAVLAASDAAAALAGPEQQPSASGRVVLRWTSDLYVRAGTSVRLSFQANPGAVLGAHEADADVVGDDLSGTFAASSPPAPVEVVERFEPDDPDDPESDWTVLPEDMLAFSHISKPGDLDVWRIPVPETPNARVKIVLSHLPADYDILLGGATTNPLNTNPLNTNPLNTNPLNTNPLNTNPVVPEEGSDPQANHAAEAVPPETLQDLPLNTNPLNTNGVRAVSIRRGTDHETIVIERVDGEDGYYPLVVSGYNGASSPQPYVVRQHVIAPHRIDLGACQPAPFPSGTGDEGTAPDPASVDPATNTLFLVARQRLTDRFGAAGRDQILDRLNDVATRSDLGVTGLVVPVEGDGSIDTAYADWDAQRCDPVRANTVAGRIRDLVLTYRRTLPIEHVVVIGDDDQIPFLRVRDGAVLGNEVGFVSTIVGDTGIDDLDGDPSNGLQAANATPLTAALQAGLFLTDDHLGTGQARGWLDHAVWIPDIGIGRLPGDVSTIVGALDHFVDSGGRLDPEVLAPSVSAVAGYDHLADGATLVADNLDERLDVTARRLISETWTRSDLAALLSFDAADRDAIVSPSGHADHRRLLPALGNLTGSTEDLFEPAGFDQLPLASVVFSMACHFGYDLPAQDGTLRDWADAVTARRGVLVANTGFNYGDTDTVAAGELFTSLLASHLDGTLTVGEAVAMTKADVYAREGQYAAEFLKAMQGMLTYGLPMYQVTATAPTTPEDGIDLSPVEVDPTTGLEIVDVDIDLPVVPAATDCPAGQSCLVAAEGERGRYYRVVGPLGYEPLAITGRPTGPRAVMDVSELIANGRRVHGAAVLGLASEDVPDVDPAFARAILARPDVEPEPEALGVIFPTLPLRVTTVDTPQGEQQVLTLLPWTFRSDDDQDGARGTFRLDTSLSLRLYLSDSGDNRPSEIRTVRALRQGDGVGFTVATAPTAGQTREVTVLYRDVLGAWHRTVLSSSDGRTWAGVGALPGSSDKPIEVVVQAVDEDGDTAFWRNKGVHVPVAPVSGSLPFSVSGSAGDNGWYLSDVTIDLPPLTSGSYEVRIDGGPWQTVDGTRVHVTGDGVHHIDIEGPDGRTVRDLVIAIDTTDPVIEVSAPGDGATYRSDEPLTVDFGCIDATAGVDECQGSQPDGSMLDLVVGTDRTFTVTARDRAGHTASLTVTYDVLSPPMDFVGFFSPVVNDEFNTVVIDDGTTVPLKWRLYRGGELLQDPDLVTGVTWQEVTCTTDVTDAQPLADAEPAASKNDQGVMAISRRLQFEATVPGSFADTCRMATVTLTDGSSHHAWFRFEQRQR